MRSDRIRETYQAFFEQHAHRRVPSASLVPAPTDSSTLLTVAGMQPFKPYFLGLEAPPASRLTSSQRCFRTPDIEQVGNTARHLTFFEMLGNFSIGDYFKPEAIAFAWQLSTDGFGFDPEQIWITVFAGDEELGLGPDEEAIELWEAQGVAAARIVRLPRSENFWQAGPTGPCGPCSELYLDRGVKFGAVDDLPGSNSDRFLEYWNLVFMSNQLHEDGSLSDLPAKNIDTGLGLERMAVIQQGVESVFDTDALAPLIELAVELSGQPYGADPKLTRAIRIIADHSRGAAGLLSDGVVPSNEDRGYVLRRVLRRAILQARVLGIEGPCLGRFAERVIELGVASNPGLGVERSTILRWIGDEELGFGRTLDRGVAMLDRLIADAAGAGQSVIDPAQAFALHDTYGFPFELTTELLAEAGLSADPGEFELLMEEQRRRARAGATTPAGAAAERIGEIVASAAPSEFVGYEQLRVETAIAAARAIDGAVVVKLEQSPFYPAGGGQVCDAGTLRFTDHGGPAEATVIAVERVGDDQVVRIAATEPPPRGAAVEATVDHFARHATMRNHTATHLLQAALRERLGDHVRQAGSAVQPDKLRFDFAHSAPLADGEVAAVELRVNGWIKDALAVRAVEMEQAEAKRLGAMALFGEKYGDWVRMVEVDGVSRELCGGTHVANTAEIGIFAIVAEGSSASNVRRIEALTGPAAIDWYRDAAASLRRTGELLGSLADPVAAAERASARLAELERAAAAAGSARAGELADELASTAEQAIRPDGTGVRLLVTRVEVEPNPKALLDLADRVSAKLGGKAAVVLGAAGTDKVAIVCSLGSTALSAGGADAVAVVRAVAPLVGGGGGGRANAAQAGGRDPAGLDQALAAARAILEAGSPEQGSAAVNGPGERLAGRG